MPRLLEIAIQTALGRQGVSVLILPGDVALQPSGDARPRVKFDFQKPVLTPDPAVVADAVARLDRAMHVAILAGAGCAGAHDEVVATAARLNAPMAHTSRGKDFLEYDNPYNVGMTGIIGGAAGYHAVLDCDVLLLLGADFAWSQFYPGRAKIIQVDLDPTHLGRRHPVTLGVVGSIKTTLEALLPRLEQHEDRRFLEAHVERFRKNTAAAKAETVPGPDSTIAGTYLAKMVNAQAAEDALFAADDGTAAVWMLRHIETGGKRRTFASLLHGTMASGMPSAIGLQKCQPGRQVICLAGDGGLAMLLGELLVQENLPIKIVVFDNGKLGFVEIEQKAAGLDPVYTDLKNPDFGEVARAVGLWGSSVSRAGELEGAVQSWLAQPGPALLHVKVRPMQLVTPPSPFVSPEAVVGMAVYSAKAMLHGKGSDVWEMMIENIP
jgi:pyruvate dehydrogenase (quinone)